MLRILLTIIAFHLLKLPLSAYIAHVVQHFAATRYETSRVWRAKTPP